MGDIASLDDYRPHMTGPVRCAACGHEWEAISPIGMFDAMECPDCGLMKGVRTTAVTTGDDGIHWACRCGNIFYVLTNKSILCTHCGTPQSGMWDDP